MYIKIDADEAMTDGVVSQKHAIWRIDEIVASLYSTCNLMLRIFNSCDYCSYYFSS